MSELYRVFATDWKDCLDFSDAALLELYNPHEVFVDDIMQMKGCFYTTQPIPLNRITIFGYVDFVELKVIPV